MASKHDQSFPAQVVGSFIGFAMCVGIVWFVIAAEMSDGSSPQPANAAEVTQAPGQQAGAVESRPSQPAAPQLGSSAPPAHKPQSEPPTPTSTTHPSTKKVKPVVAKTASPPTAAPTALTEPLDRGYLKVDNLPTIAVATCLDSIRPVYTAIAEKDEQGVGELLSENEMFCVLAKTPVSVIESGAFSGTCDEIRIDGGRHKGRFGYVPREWVMVTRKKAE